MWSAFIFSMKSQMLCSRNIVIVSIPNDIHPSSLYRVLLRTCMPSHFLTLKQGCGNTMPNLSDQVPFHSGQVENFYLLVLGQVQCIK